MKNASGLVAPLKRELLFERVAQELANLILTGELKAGTKLPSEHNLAQQFGVSRNVVREGLRSLIEQGLVVVRAGSGVYVRVPDESKVVDAFSRYMQLNRTENWVDELYEVRRTLEADIAALAAERATEEDVKALEDALASMHAHTDDPRQWALADWDFHKALARATHNTLFPLLLEPLYEQVLRAFEEGWYYPKAYESGLRFHAEILKQMRAHHAKAVREAMLAHLQVSYLEVSNASWQRSAEEIAV
ncbi:MAG: FadR family transcriptional regulator [Anaerolineae bacterium]|nr:FadR family transcriptional regulator [Anaerolineae bacterium]